MYETMAVWEVPHPGRPVGAHARLRERLARADKIVYSTTLLADLDRQRGSSAASTPIQSAT